MQIVPSQSAVEAAGGLRDLLSNRCAAGHSDEFFAGDWSSLWSELERNDWLRSGRTFAEAAEYNDALLELVPIAEVWGEFIVPLPFSEAVLIGIDEDELRPVGVATSDSSFWMSYANRLDPEGLLSSPIKVDAFSPSRTIAEHSIEGVDLSEKLNDAIVVLWAAEAVGAASVGLQLATAYSGERETYGRRILTYQALRHLMADMLVSVELARTGVYWMAQDPSERWKVAGDVLSRARETLQDTIQIYGGIGFTWDAGIHFYLRHVMTLEKLVRAHESANARVIQ